MSKALKVAAVVVGVAAVVVTGGAALGLLPAVIGTIGGVTVTAAALGAGLSLVAMGLSVAAGLTAKKPKLASAGTQLDFYADPVAGEPYFMGQGATGMGIVHEATWSTKNKYLGMIGVLSLGPISSFDGFTADLSPVTFSGGNAVGYYHDWMYLTTQLGAQPEAAALSLPIAGFPDWGSSSKLSGLAAAGMVFVADTDNGKIFAAGTPKMLHNIHGVLAYDPRLDSTNGGSGSQRPRTESTYAYSANPWVHHGTYAIGRWQNGIRVLGPGLPASSIDWASHIDAANVADSHSWKISGRIMSTDRKWEVLKAIAQAGGGYPVPSGSKLAAVVNMPRVSLATINQSDVKGSVQAPQMASRRDRLNGAIPRFRSKDHGWEIIPGLTVRSASYLSADGGNEHTREIEYQLVADQGDGVGKTQAAQLAAYDVANSREKIGISVELGLMWGAYKSGDCLTLNLPDANLINQKAVVIGRSLDPDRNTITLQFRTEDDAKHTWALSLTGTTAPPPTTIVQSPGTGDSGVETAVQTQNFINNSLITGLTFSIAAGGAVTISNHSRAYYDRTVSVTGTGGTPHATGAASGDRVYIFYDDPARAGGAVTYQHLVLAGGVGDASGSTNSAANPYRHYVCSGLVPATGSTGGGSNVGDGGGTITPPCVSVETPITLADGSTIRAGDIKRFDQIRTIHEQTGEEGIYHVAAIEIVANEPVYRCEIAGRSIRATADHRFCIDGKWITAKEIGKRDGRADVVKMTVADAHTYISDGVLSHNIKSSG